MSAVTKEQAALPGSRRERATMRPFSLLVFPHQGHPLHQRPAAALCERRKQMLALRQLREATWGIHSTQPAKQMLFKWVSCFLPALCLISTSGKPRQLLTPWSQILWLRNTPLTSEHRYVSYSRNLFFNSPTPAPGSSFLRSNKSSQALPFSLTLTEEAG